MRAFSTQFRDETFAFAKRLASQLIAGDVITLSGPLGVGKTVFVQGLSAGLDVAPGYVVNSPTFVFAQIYQGRLPVYHIDLYRLEKESELKGLGLEEMVGTDGVALIEWYDRLPQIWPGERMEVRLAFGEGDGRILEVTTVGPRWKNALEGMESGL